MSVSAGAMQLDGTHALELGITIGGQRYDHLLCHVVLPPTRRGSGRGIGLLARDRASAAKPGALDRYWVIDLDDLGYVQQDRAEREVLFTFFSRALRAAQRDDR